MRFNFFFLAILAVSIAEASAVDLDVVKRTPARIEVVNMQPVALSAGTDKKGWARVPANLTKNGAVVYMPTGNTNGVADIRVMVDGYLLLACNYDYQGNSGGSWDEEDWNERKFRSKGWRKLSKGDLGGDLVKGDNREQIVFVKQVRKGDALRIRCNKYDPPFPIVFATR